MPKKAMTFDDVRKMGLALPDVEESSAYGGFALKVRKTLFACAAINKSAEPNSLMVRLGMEERDKLLKARPDIYYVTPHYAPYPCVVVRLAKIPRNDLRELLGMSWRFVMEHASQRAPRRKASAKPRTSARPRRRG